MSYSYHIPYPATEVAAGNDQTELPTNLDYLPREEVVDLLKRVASERDSLGAELQKKKSKKPRVSQSPHVVNTGYMEPSIAAAFPSPQQQQPVAYDVNGTKKRIFKNASSQIKKTVHSERNKPTTDIMDNVPSEFAMLTLMSGYEPKSNTNSFMTWSLDGEQVLDWLNIRENPYIHPVSNRIKTMCFAGTKPYVYAHVAIESLEMKWERKSGNVKLKFRTYVVGTGRPPHFHPLDDVYMPKRGPNGKFAKSQT